MLEHIKGNAPISLSFGAAACMLSLLILMGLKLRWFRARMTFDEAPNPQLSTYVGVYRSNFDEAFDYHRPSVLTPAPQTTSANQADVTNGVVATTSNGTKKKEVQLKEPKVKETKSKNPLKVKEVNATVVAIQSGKTKELKVKEVKQKEANVKDKKDPKVKETKTKEPKVKEVKSKEPTVKEVKSKESTLKEIKTKDLKIKEVKTKEPKVKETKIKVPKDVKIKEAKAKEGKTKDPKVKDVNIKAGSKANEQVLKQPEIKSQTSQNKALPSMQLSNEQSKSQDVLPKEKDKTFTFAPPKAPQLPNGTPQPMKTFGLMQPSRGQSNPMVAPIPQQEKRANRNPAAMGMDAYKSPKGMSESFYETQSDSVYLEISGAEDRGNGRVTTASSTRQMLFDMDEESET